MILSNFKKGKQSRCNSSPSNRHLQRFAAVLAEEIISTPNFRRAKQQPPIVALT